MTPLAFLRLARRFYCSAEWRDATNPRERLATAFRSAYAKAPEHLRALAWRTYGACGPREAPRARWFRWFDLRRQTVRNILAHPAGSWARRHWTKRARELCFLRDPRDSDPEAFRLP